MGIALIGIDRKRFAVKGHDPYGMDPKGKQPEQAEAEPEYLSAAPYQIVPAVRRFKGCKGCGDILQGGKVLQLFLYYFYSGWEYRAFDDHPAHTLPLSDFINSTWIPPPSVSSSRLSSHSSWITAKREGSVP